MAAASISVPSNIQAFTQSLRNGKNPASDQEARLLKWLDQIEMEGKLWAKTSGVDCERWISVYNGTQRIQGNPKFFGHIIRPTIDRYNATLTENKPVCKILPWRNGLEQLSEMLEKLFDCDWHATAMQRRLESMAQKAAVMGSAGIDCAWNPAGQFGQGCIDPVVLDRRQVIFDPSIRDAADMDKAMYVRIETIKNIWDIQSQYPGRGMLVTPDLGLSNVNTGDIVTPAQTVNMNVANSFKSRNQKLEEGPIPRKLQREYFLRDPAKDGTGQLRFPRGRQIERAGEVILDDAQNPYWDGCQPVVWFDLKSDMESPWGRSQVDALRYISDAFNRIGNLFVENSILAGNVVVLHDSDAISNETIAKLKNAAAIIVPKKFGRTIEWRPPPPMPPHMMGFMSFALSFIDYLVGLKDGQMEGRGRIEMRSGVQLEGLQNAAQILVKASARRLEDFLERLGQKWLSRVFQFYTGVRLMYQLGNDNDYHKYEFEYGKIQSTFQQILKNDGKDDSKAESLKDVMQTAWRQFAFKISPGSSLAANKVAKAQLLAQLAETGRFPFSKVMLELGYDNPDELQQMAQAEIQKYGPPQPPTKKAGKK